MNNTDIRKISVQKTAQDDSDLWDGKGELPPVNSRCLCGHTGQVRILAHTNVNGKDATVYQSIERPTVIDWTAARIFTPIRTAAQRAEDESKQAMSMSLCESHPCMDVSKSDDAANHLYQDIREGRIPGVELSKDDDPTCNRDEFEKWVHEIIRMAGADKAPSVIYEALAEGRIKVSKDDKPTCNRDEFEKHVDRIVREGRSKGVRIDEEV